MAPNDPLAALRAQLAAGAVPKPTPSSVHALHSQFGVPAPKQPSWPIGISPLPIKPPPAPVQLPEVPPAIATGDAQVDVLVADFETAIQAGKAEITAIVNELKTGGLTARIHALEMAVASLAAPLLSQSAHDGHGLLGDWFKKIEPFFTKTAAGATDVRTKAHQLQAALKAALAKA